MSPRSTAWRAYEQISETLRHRVTSGDYPQGSRIPSEAKLCAEFSVARNTIRRALIVLEEEGLIETLPGRGRVVRELGIREGTQRTLPEYRKIAFELSAQIEDGTLGPGDPLPSEAAIVRDYNVSRGTARQALADLQGAGLIESRHGKGRYVLDVSKSSHHVRARPADAS